MRDGDTRPQGSSSHGEDEGHLLARGQLSCSRPLGSVVGHIALVVRVLRAALAKEVCAFSRHGCAGIGLTCGALLVMGLGWQEMF